MYLFDLCQLRKTILNSSVLENNTLTFCIISSKQEHDYTYNNMLIIIPPERAAPL